LLAPFPQVLRNTDLLAFGFSPTSGSLGTVLSTILEQDVSSWTYVNMDELRESQIIKIIYSKMIAARTLRESQIPVDTKLFTRSNERSGVLSFGCDNIRTCLRAEKSCICEAINGKIKTIVTWACQRDKAWALIRIHAGTSQHMTKLGSVQTHALTINVEVDREWLQVNRYICVVAGPTLFSGIFSDMPVLRTHISFNGICFMHGQFPTAVTCLSLDMYTRSGPESSMMRKTQQLRFIDHSGTIQHIRADNGTQLIWHFQSVTYADPHCHSLLFEVFAIGLDGVTHVSSEMLVTEDAASNEYVVIPAWWISNDFCTYAAHIVAHLQEHREHVGARVYGLEKQLCLELHDMQIQCYPQRPIFRSLLGVSNQCLTTTSVATSSDVFIYVNNVRLVNFLDKSTQIWSGSRCLFDASWFFGQDKSRQLRDVFSHSSVGDLATWSAQSRRVLATVLPEITCAVIGNAPGQFLEAVFAGQRYQAEHACKCGSSSTLLCGVSSRAILWDEMPT
jgi:hypothetical protein